MKKLINNKDKIYIAGHRGMVGKAIHKKLNDYGYNNILVENKSKIDLRNDYSVKNWFNINKPDIVIIAAAKVGGIEANRKYPTKFLLDNLKIQNNLIESSWKHNVKRLLFLGSSCIYPKNSNQPIKEESLLTGPLEETNQWYAIAKIAGIQLCNALRLEHDFDAISLMPTNLYGPGDSYHIQNSHVLPSLIRRFKEATISKSDSVTCWGSGNPLREFLYVDDLADACIFALENWSTFSSNTPKDDSGNILGHLNIGTGKDISIKEVAKKIANLVGYTGQINWDTSKPDGTYKKQLDINRIIKLGWKPKINIEAGLQMTINYYEKELLENKLRKEKS